MATKITDQYFKFGTLKYLRGNAHRVELCTYGEKKDRVGADSYLAPEAKVKVEHVAPRVRFNTRATIDWDEVSRTSLGAEADLRFFSLGKKGAVDLTYNKAKAGRLQLVSFAINEGPLTTMLNQDADGARKFLAEEGKDGRIVSEVWVVVDAELGDHFAAHAAGSMEVRAFGSSLEVSVSGGKRGTQTISLSPFTTFAYALHKVKKWNKDKTKIENMEDDYKGPR